MLGLVTSSRPPALLSVPPATHGDLLGGSGRSKLLWDILRQGEDPFADASPIGKKFRRALEASFIRPAYHLIDEASSECGTRKLLLSLPDTGSEVETVIIPSPNGEFSTLCVSSQVGCRQACSFCATGTMGLVRSLGAEEIVAQVHAAAACIRGSRGALPPLRNAVFMGMGEPADNLEAVSVALESMVHPHGFQLAKRHVCVSTVGPSPEHIRKLAPLPCRLAWSVHAADDELRRLLVPTTRHSMVELRDAWRETLEVRGDRGLMAEATLIDGVNDDAGRDAERLFELLAPLPGKTRINLIPYNANAGLGAAGQLFRPSPPEAVRAFQDRLVNMGVICTVRTPRGAEDSSACGMLRVEHQKRSQQQEKQQEV
jgi:23S rRNA (adenine2503-C2)-methyltransferase